MNENNFNNQVPSGIPQQTVTPVAPVMPVAGATPVAPMTPVMPVTPKKPMDKKEIMKWVGVGAGALIALAVFIPYYSISFFGITESVSVWESGKFSAILLALFGVIAALTYFFNKAKSFSLLAAGIGFWYPLTLLAAQDFSFEGLSFGFWLMLLGGIALIVLYVMENMDELKKLVPSKPVTPVVPVTSAQPQAPVTPVQQVTPVQPVPTVSPVTPVTPVAQVAVVCKNCGQPKKNPTDEFCQNCGQKY